MKHLKLFFALFAMLALGVGNAWAETIVLKASDGFPSSYQSSDKTFTKSEITFGCLRTMYNANGTPAGWYKQQVMQLSKNASSTVGGDIWNVTSVNIARITVKLAVNNNDFTLFYGTSAKPSTNSIAKSSASSSTETITYSGYSNRAEQPGQTTTINVFTFDLSGKGATHFLIDNGSKANYIWEIIIETSDGSEEPTDCTPLTPTLSYESTTLLTSTTSSAPTLDGNTGEGTVTYTSSNTEVATVDAETGVITAVNAGTTTITATIAATGEYCEGKATATITVTPLISCSEVYGLADDATFVLKDFTVTYVNGKYTYIKDNTGYGLIFNNAGEYGLKAGDQVASTKLEGKKDTYNGLVEIIPTTTFANLEFTSGTAPAPEAMNVLPANADVNKYVKFEDVTFASTTFSSKKVTGKINAGNITFYDQFATNATFNTSKKYDVIGAVSIYNSTLQVNFISAEEVEEPTLNVEITNADFGKIAINGKAERTLTLNGSLLTNAVSLAIEGDGAEYFELASNSVTPVDAKIEEAKIKIYYQPTVEGSHTATLKITSDELAEQTITLQGQAVQQHTVHFFVNGEEDETLAKKVLSGEKLTEIPTAISCDPLEYPTFIGWSTSAITGTTDVEPTDLLDLNTTTTADCNYYAVFAKETTTSSSSESATMAYSGTTTNMTDGNNASTVGLDEALFTITSDKGGQGNHVGLNKAGDIRLYANKTDGNGNILTIAMAEGYTITQISLAIKQNATYVVKANGQSISGTGNVYDINHSSCSIQNTTTGETTQLQLNSITISYTTSTISKEYLTTCESATPTYTVTYNLDGGESTCETSVVVEQNGELTLCDVPTKKGHTFLKWKDQSDNEYEAGATITVSSNLTLTAQWQKESYKVTWTSLGEEVASANVEYNSQPTKPAEDPTYTCLSGTKEFVGWTTQEIDGVGVPANLYTDEFPVVTEPITYYAVFAGKSAEASITTNTLLVTEKLGNYTSGNMKDDQQSVWNYFAGGLEDGETLYLALRNKESETSYIESPKFTGTVQSIVAHVKNGSGSKVRTVYLRSSATAQPTEGDLGETSIPTSNNSEVTLNITPSFDKFFIQVSDGLQFHKIVVTSGIAAGAYIDYITSCEAVTSSITIEDVAMNVGDTHTINATITPAAAESAVTYTIKENTENAISLSGNTITALAEGTATITATIEDAANYTGTTVDFTVTVNPAPVTDKVVILAQYDGKWYAMKAEYLSDNTDRLVGVLVNYIDGKLYEVDDAIKPLIEWDRTTSVDNVTFQNNSKYLKGKTTTVLNLEAEATGLYQWNSDYTMVLSGSSTVRTFMYNGEAFRNFAVSNAGKVVNEVLYSELPVVTAPVYATGNPVYTRTVTNGRYGTICIPYASSSYSGAEFYEVSWLEEGVGLYLDQLTADAQLEAGKPYIFRATSTEIKVTCTGDAVAAPVDGANGLTGTFTDIAAGGVLVDNYIIAQNKIWVANDQNTLPANRAYINKGDLPTTEQAKLPGRRRVCMGENAETGVDNIITTDAPVKVIENGQLIIIRDGVKYNVQGQKL